ncbi:MAG TPA: transporter substrate-binding domain-containing protein, partial [bacterium]|nr:transporter substrate-binding domain-containing protein [bacterium]
MTRMRMCRAVARWLPLVLVLTASIAYAHIPGEPIPPVPSPDPLSPTERAWLQAHPVLRLSPDPDFPPIEFFNERGEYCGLAADYAHLLEQKLGITFTVVRCRDWSEVLTRAQAREVDVLNAAVATADRARYMLFGTPYLHMPMVIITRRDSDDLPDTAALSGKRVALVRDYGHVELLLRSNPAIIGQMVPTAAQGLRDVASGRVDAFYHDLATASYALDQEHISDLKITGTGASDNNSGFAVRSDWPELMGILQRGMARVSDTEFAALKQKWIHMDLPGPAASTRWLWFAGGMILVAGALLAFVAMVNRMLKREVRRRTQQLAKNEHLLQTALRLGQMGYGTIAVDGSITWSPEVYRMHGMPPDQPPTPAAVMAVMHPEDRERVGQILAVVQRGEYAPGIEYRVQTGSGQWRWLFGEWHAIHDEHGEYAGVIGVNQDITARKEQKTELR